jgi:proline iminopeptidase
LRAALVCAAAIGLAACGQRDSGPPASYFDNAGRADAWSGGARMIPIATPEGDFHVWVKRVGNNPKLKLLTLHGGPAYPHDYLEAMDSYLPAAGIEYYYYDQLGAGNSDQPNDDRLWTLDRYVDEVEQVRKALGLTKDDFCLYGQSWGGLLAIEYALKYQRNLKCLVISNMMASIPAYNDYAHKVLMPQMDPKVLAEVLALEKAGKTADPRYEELLIKNYYEQHVLRRPAEQWPDPVLRTFTRANAHVYTLMQGPSEMGASGRLVNWDRFADLRSIAVPTLVIGAKYDTMDPAYMEKMASELPKGEYAFMPEGSHLAMYDDQQRYFTALTGFLKKQE